MIPQLNFCFITENMARKTFSLPTKLIMAVALFSATPTSFSQHQKEPLSFRQPISDNSNSSTLALALRLARQFASRREDNAVTAQNVEWFQRRSEDDMQTLAESNKIDKPKKMYSWWTKHKTTTLASQTIASESENSEIASAEPEPHQDTLVTATTIDMTLPPVKETSSTTIKTDEYKMTTEPSESEIIIPSTSIIPSKPTRKPRPSKRTRRPPTLDDDEEASSSTSKQTPPNTTTSTTTTTEMSHLPESVPDPFGVKRKFISVVKSAVNKTKTFVASSGEKAARIGQNAARHAGIIALEAAGRVANLTKNSAEDVYLDLAKKLNATEILDRYNKSTKSDGQNSNWGQGQSQEQQEDDHCFGVSLRSNEFIIFLGTLGMILFRSLTV